MGWTARPAPCGAATPTPRMSVRQAQRKNDTASSAALRFVARHRRNRRPGVNLSTPASAGGDLLGDAVDVAAAQEDLTCRDTHHAAVREQPFQPLRGGPVGAPIQER